MVAQGNMYALPAVKTDITGRITPQTSQPKRRIRRAGHEISKVGMIASLTIIALTGFRVLKPMLPLHPLAGMAFIGFALWHVYQKDQRIAYSEALQQKKTGRLPDTDSD